MRGHHAKNRSVKTWPRHPLEDYLIGQSTSANGEYINAPVADSTAHLYGATIHRMEQSGLDPIAWYKRMHADTGYTKGTITSARMAIVHLMMWRGEVTHVAEAKALLPSPGRRHADVGSREALSDREVEELFEAIRILPEPVDTHMKLLLYTGLRNSEGCRLDIADIERNRGHWYLHVNRGKGNKARRLELSPDAKAVLETFLDGLSYDAGPLFLWEYQFKSGPAVRRLKPYVVNRELDIVLEKVGGDSLRQAICPHRLRHTMATDMHESGISLENIRRYLGHVDMGTVSRYLTLRPGRFTQELEKLPRREIPQIGQVDE